MRVILAVLLVARAAGDDTVTTTTTTLARVTVTRARPNRKLVRNGAHPL